VERTHPDQSLHKFDAKRLEIMSEEIMIALEPNQGHALAMLELEKK
jgi:hypothetical protein